MSEQEKTLGQQLLAWLEDVDVAPNPSRHVAHLLRRHFSPAQINLVASHATKALREEVEKVKRVPGMWKCRTCGFVQMKSTIHPNGIFSDTKFHEEPCPNEGDVMFPVLWADLAQENQDFYIKEKAKFDVELTSERELSGKLAEALKRLREFASSEYFMPGFPFGHHPDVQLCDKALAAYEAREEGRSQSRQRGK